MNSFFICFNKLTCESYRINGSVVAIALFTNYLYCVVACFKSACDCVRTDTLIYKEVLLGNNVINFYSKRGS